MIDKTYVDWTYTVAETMAQMHTSIPETYTCERSSQADIQRSNESSMLFVRESDNLQHSI